MIRFLVIKDEVESVYDSALSLSKELGINKTMSSINIAKKLDKMGYYVAFTGYLRSSIGIEDNKGYLVYICKTQPPDKYKNIKVTI